MSPICVLTGEWVEERSSELFVHSTPSSSSSSKKSQQAHLPHHHEAHHTHTNKAATSRAAKLRQGLANYHANRLRNKAQKASPTSLRTSIKGDLRRSAVSAQAA